MDRKYFRWVEADYLRIIELRELGYTNKAIAEEIGRSVSSVRIACSKLIKEGRIKRLT